MSPLPHTYPLEVMGTLYRNKGDRAGTIVDLVPMLKVLPDRFITNLNSDSWVLKRSNTTSSFHNQGDPSSGETPMVWEPITSQWLPGSRRSVWASPAARVTANVPQVLIWLATYRYANFCYLLTDFLDSAVWEESDLAVQRAEEAAFVAFPQPANPEAVDTARLERAAFFEQHIPFTLPDDDGAQIASVPWLLSHPERGRHIVLNAIGYDMSSPTVIMGMPEAQDRMLCSVADRAVTDLLAVYTQAQNCEQDGREVCREEPSIIGRLWPYLVGSDINDPYRMDLLDASIFAAARAVPEQARLAVQRRNSDDISAFDGHRLIASLVGGSFTTVPTTVVAEIRPVIDDRFPNNPLSLASAPTIRGLWYRHEDTVGAPCDLTGAVALLSRSTRIMFVCEKWTVQHFNVMFDLASGATPHSWNRCLLSKAVGSRRTTVWRDTDRLVACPSDAAVWFLNNSRGDMLNYVLDGIIEEAYADRVNGRRVAGMPPFTPATAPVGASKTQIRDTQTVLADTAWSVACVWYLLHISPHELDQWDVTPTEMRNIRTLLTTAIETLSDIVSDIAGFLDGDGNSFANVETERILGLMPYIMGEDVSDTRKMTPPRAWAWRAAGYTASNARRTEFADPTRLPIIPESLPGEDSDDDPDEWNLTLTNNRVCS